jgi:hypothetical protein
MSTPDVGVTPLAHKLATSLRAAGIRAAVTIGVPFALAGCMAELEEPTPLAAADASFLVALGSASDFAAQTQGGHGTLLPLPLFELLPMLTRIDEPAAIYENLHVVAVRLDPCFHEGVGSVACAPQIRMSLQPVFADSDGQLTTRDATIHLFYSVAPQELTDVSQEIADQRLRAGRSSQIGVIDEPDAVIQALLPYVGADRLFRLSFVAVHASGQAWTFGQFDRQGTQWVPHVIPGSNENEQHLTSTGGVFELDATILPFPVIEPDIAAFLDAGERATIDEPSVQAAEAALVRLLDPNEHNAGTVDCASCHMATTALQYLRSSPGQADFDPAYEDSQNQRMFGFYGTLPSISPRVLAETEQVLQAFEQAR